MPLAYIKMIEGSDDDVDPGYGNEGGKPHPGGGPIRVPPLPPGQKPPVGTWPPRPLPPHISPPIFIDNRPEHPINMPPGTIWPPLNPGDGIGGKVLAVVWLVGIGYKWVVLQAPQISNELPGGMPGLPGNELPGTPEPK